MKTGMTDEAVVFRSNYREDRLLSRALYGVAELFINRELLA